jgi:hypothetical protein
MKSRFRSLFVITALVFAIASSACSSSNPPQGGPANGPQGTLRVPASETPAPTVTDTPAPTATIAPTSTPDVAALAKTLGLPQDHTYSYTTVGEQTVLVDGLNQARRAIFENGQWRKLDYTKPADAELMYGALVPKDGTYLDTKPHLKNVNGSLYNYYEVKGAYLGDLEEEKVNYQAKTITIPVLLIGFRSQDGNVHVLRFGSDSADLLPPHYRTLGCADNGSDRIIVLTEDMPAILKALNIGTMMRVDVLFAPSGTFPGIPRYTGDINNALDNNASTVMMLSLIRRQLPEQITKAEADGIAAGNWPERTITVFSIQNPTFEYWACK